MRRHFAFRVPERLCLGLLYLVAIVAMGCREAKTIAPVEKNDAHAVEIVRPERRTIRYTVVQPGFVNAYEQTAIYSKVSGFIQHFYVDIGQDVTKDELLAEIFIPELGEELQRKQAQVELSKRQVDQAKQLVLIAACDLQMAVARLAEAKANVGKYDAEVVRWDSEVKRLTEMAEEKVVDQQVLAETKRQLDSSKAARDAARATVAAREAARATADANLGKAKIDVETQNAAVKALEADERKAAAMLAYAKITAPYDGVITVRNANTGDYVQAVAGDKSTLNPSPIFVVARTDLVRIFVDVPENYAQYVHKGMKALIRIEALGGQRISAVVARTSWSLHERTRTLHTEIDLPLKGHESLRPGAYVYGEIPIERANVYALPQETVLLAGNETYCYLVENGRATQASIETGLSDGKWIEIIRMKVDGHWKDAASSREVIASDLGDILEGQRVTVKQHERPPSP